MDLTYNPLTLLIILSPFQYILDKCAADKDGKAGVKYADNCIDKVKSLAKEFSTVIIVIIVVVIAFEVLCLIAACVSKKKKLVA